MTLAIFVLLLLSLYSCDKCTDIACTTPPHDFVFSLSSDAVIDSSAVVIINTTTKKNLKVRKEGNLYTVSQIGWQTGKNNKDYTLTVNSKTYSFIYHTESESVNCCALLGDLKEFSSKDFEITSSSTSGHHTIDSR